MIATNAYKLIGIAVVIVGLAGCGGAISQTTLPTQPVSPVQPTSVKRMLNYTTLWGASSFPGSTLQQSITSMGNQVTYFDQQYQPDYAGNVTLASGSTFIPIFYGLSDVNTAELNAAKTYGSTLMTFNEPDCNNISVALALAAWPALEATGMILSAPATCGDASEPNGWLGQFMADAAAAGYKVGFIVVHCYPGNINYSEANLNNPGANATATINNLTAVHNLYPNYPIWLGETALTYNTLATHEQQEAYMKALLPQLEAMPSWFVHYSWWTTYFWEFGDWGLNLTDQYGNINPLGQIYNSLGTYDPPRQMVLNGGFETGDFSDWTTQISSGGQAGVSSSEAYSGYYGAWLGGGQAQISQTISGLSTNATYTMNADSYIWTCDGGQASIAVSNYGGSALSNAITTTNWNQLTGYQSIQFITCSTCTSVQVSISVNDPDTWVFVDNVYIRALTE